MGGPVRTREARALGELLGTSSLQQTTAAPNASSDACGGSEAGFSAAQGRRRSRGLPCPRLLTHACPRCALGACLQAQKEVVVPPEVADFNVRDS